MRRAPNLRERCAAALLQLKKEDGTWLIPEPQRTTGSAREIMAVVEWHHYPIPHGWDGSTQPQNLVPLTKADHATVTRTQTVPMIARVKKIAPKLDAHKATLEAKAGSPRPPPPPQPEHMQRFHKLLTLAAETPKPTRPKRKWPSRPLRAWRKPKKDTP
jgi:hypothetical protein